MYFILNDENGTAKVTWGGERDAMGTAEYYGEITIPSTVSYGDKQYSVTSIGQYALSYCGGLTSVVIPASVTSIERNAFCFSAGLNSISIPTSVTSIGHNAFVATGWYNNQPDGLLYLDDCLLGHTGNDFIPKELIVTEGTRLIADQAFWYSNNLQTVTIPASVIAIGTWAFDSCPNLSEVFFSGNSDIILGNDCFDGPQATIYVADTKNFPSTWADRPVTSWRSGKGDGTKESPYEIENYINLYGFSLEVQQGNTSICGKLTADITANTGVLNEDGTLKTGTFKSWLPIGTSEKPYAGTFDGNGHTISGLYINDASMDFAALFGKVVNSANIRDLGVKDSYFRGNTWVAGICGELSSGTIENCWNGATVIGCHSSPSVGGIAGSCWKNASVKGCYNIGNVSVESGCSDSQCGGICGIVAKNTSATYSVSNCVSLKGKCEEAYNVYTENYNYSELLPNESYSSIGDASVSNVYNDKDASAFKSGEVCWILNGNQRSAKWRQQLGTDSYPAWASNYIVLNDDSGYYNETVCEATENHLHSWMEPKTITLYDGSQITYCRCEECRKYYQSDDRTIELSGEECSRIQPSTGDGKKENPYQIATLENLMWFAEHVNQGNVSACAILMDDITMNTNVLSTSGELSIKHTSPFDVWTPIGEGADDKAYSGEFDGNGHTISGLYCEDTGKNNIGLFGKANNGAYIHDLGLKDSYFSGNSWVAGICGDFASGRIENCWNGATVIANSTVNGGSCAGGITASCWTAASIRGCYNIGKISVESSNKSQCGGICGTVAKNTGVDCSVSYCVSLEGKCDSHKAYNLYNVDAVVENVVTRNSDAFKSGEVCYLLNSGVTDGSQKWYQTLEEDVYPVLDNSRGVIYHGYDGDELKYSNTKLSAITPVHHEVCDATCNAVGYTRECWEDTKSGKIFAEATCATELNPAYAVTYPSVTTVPECMGTDVRWNYKEEQTYDGVDFEYAEEKNITDGGYYQHTEYVTFKIKDATASKARLKWALIGDKSKLSGTFYYTINDGEAKKMTMLGSYSPNVESYSLPDLKEGDVVKFHTDGFYTWNLPLMWAVTLEYCPGHSIEHVEAKAATCTVKGNKKYWYCAKCDKHFANAECTTVMTDWEIPALGHKATHNVKKDATCTENGNIEYWHCSNCNLNYSDQACTNQITGSVVIPATHHANKELVPYKAPTADKEGNIEYWHCHDCKKNFEDNGCTKEIAGTDYILAKLLNVMHIDFYGTSTPIEKEHYMDATEIGFTEEGDIIFTTNKQADNKPTVTYPASMIKEIGFFNGAPTVEFKANEDPKNEGDYYTTFYSSLEAYTIPEGVKAYTATLDKKNEILNLKETGVIPAGAAVILKSDKESFSLTADEYVDVDGLGDLKGTDVEIPAPENCYILSGTSKLGMGLYPWAGEGKKLSANKAYLQQTEASSAKAYMFNFVDNTDNTDGIENTSISSSEAKHLYNLQGIRVNDRYKGIVIKNGKKTLNK